MAKRNNKIYSEKILEIILERVGLNFWKGETLEDLFDGVYGTVEMHKLDVL